jgi:hypothetical protein
MEFTHLDSFIWGCYTGWVLHLFWELAVKIFTNAEERTKE